jgi:hypothetical protein
MHATELLLLVLLVTLPALSVLSRVVNVPYPILLVAAGALLALLPGLPAPQLQPDLVLVIFLPPLLYVAAFFADLRSLRADLRSISALSIGLVGRGRRLRGPVAELPARRQGDPRRSAGRARAAAPRGRDLERGDAPRRARARPRGLAARALIGPPRSHGRARPLRRAGAAAPLVRARGSCGARATRRRLVRAGAPCAARERST